MSEFSERYWWYRVTTDFASRSQSPQRLPHERQTSKSPMPVKAHRSASLPTSKRLMFGSSLKDGLRRFSHFCVSARRSAPLFGKFRIQSALIGIFFTVHRRNVRWIFIEVGSPDPKLLPVRVDPLPHAFA